MDSEGQKIGGIDELEHGKGYILVANNDPLIRIRYNTKAIQTVHQGPPGLAGSTMKNEHMAHIRKVSQKWPKERSFNQQPSFNNQTSFSEKPAEEPRVSQAKRKESVKKTPATPKKAVTPKPATSEAIGTNPENFDSIDDAAAQEEVYGEQELQYLEAANAKTPRTPVAKEADPQSALVSPQNATKSGARSAAIATPAPNSKSQGNIRSAIMSPEAQARSAVMSPEAQARSAVMSAKSNARSALSSAQSSVPGSEAEEEVAPSTRASSAQQIAQKPDTPKSKRSSKENLKAGAKETLVSRAQTPKSRKQTPGGALDDNSTRDAEPAVTKSTKSSADNLKSMTKSTKSSRDALKTPKAPDA